MSWRPASRACRAILASAPSPEASQKVSPDRSTVTGAGQAVDDLADVGVGLFGGGDVELAGHADDLVSVRACPAGKLELSRLHALRLSRHYMLVRSSRLHHFPRLALPRRH